MTFDPDINADYLTLDGLETFSLRQGNLDPATVNNCLREALVQADVQFLSTAGLGVQSGDLIVNLWAPELGSLTPGAGDRLTDSGGTTYTIQNSSYTPRSGRYRTLCRQAASA